MKRVFLFLGIISFLSACQSAPEGERAQTEQSKEAAVSTEGETYNVDIANSKVNFYGSKPVATHHGVFVIKDGIFQIKDGNIVSGNFNIDINSMKIVDEGLDDDTKAKLTGHLLSEDFFAANNFGTSKFEITSVEVLNGDANATHKISGNLTLKDSSQNISFPAKISISDNKVNTVAEFVIDRTKWGLFYGNDKSLGDKFIYPEVKIALDIQSTKG